MDKPHLNVQIEELKGILERHIADETGDIKLVKSVLFGDREYEKKGMVHKVDEMYDMMTQVKGIPMALKLVVLLGASVGALIAIKSFLLR